MQEEEVGAFSYNYIKAVCSFETLAIKGQELQFYYQKLRVGSNEPTERQITSLAELEYGFNTLVYIRFTILRVVRLEHCTYMLATTNRPYKSHTLAVLVAVHHPQKKEACILQECLMPRVQIRVANPFRAQLEDESIHQLIFLSEYVTIIKSGAEKGRASSDELRQQGNNYFKEKRYVQAILRYELALGQILGASGKNRSILYSNTAACFFELKFYHSCSIYADLAVATDPTYNKGYYRKINSYLELKRYSEVVPLLTKIHTLISKPDFDGINQKYTQYVANESGYFNWMSLLKEAGSAQGEYFSEKMEKVRSEQEVRYYAKQQIPQYEIILINKPLIYIKQTGNKFTECFVDFINQTWNHYLYDEHFEESIHFLPCKCHPTFKDRQQYYNNYRGNARPLPKIELFNKMQRCIFEQKSLDKSQAENGYGIWKEMFYFQNKCIPNCTGVHINGSFVVCALTLIEKGTPLSIDFIADVEVGKRKQTLKIKFNQDCGCQICQFKESSIQFSKVEELYDRFQRYDSCKIKKQHIWAIINYEWKQREVLEEQFGQLIYYYIYVMEKECEWDDILNLLRLKEQNYTSQINNNIDESIKRLLIKYLKIKEKNIDAFYSLVIQKYIHNG